MPVIRPIIPHIGGLDSLRFICAFSVMLCHLGGPPLLEGIDTTEPFSRVLGGLYNNLFPGAPSVIVFFLISGFCIHYPTTIDNGVTFNPAVFCVRRFVRIWLPVYVLDKIVRALGFDFGALNGVIMWSVHCEMIYYAAYPLLRGLRRMLSWPSITLLSFGGAGLTLLLNGPENEFLNLGTWKASAVGIPCWLLGVLLAETARAPMQTTRKLLWMSRIGIYGLACLATILRFHASVGFPVSLVFYSLFAYLWLRIEINWRKEHPAPSWLERAGAWSYSLYLMHFPSEALIVNVVGPNEGVWLTWLLTICGTLVMAFAFFLLVEKPSHLLAKNLGGKLQRWTQAKQR